MNINIKLQMIILIAYLQNATDVGKKISLMIFNLENPKFNMKEKDD